MKSNLFKYSVLTVGVVAAMGVAHAAQQPTGGTSAGSFDVANQASASYTVAGNTASQTATSNIVTITVSEQSSFTLLTDNVDKTINPKANSTVNFTHTLTNSGNVDDTYTLRLTNATSGDDFDYSGYSVTYLLNNTGTAITVPLTNGVGTISLPAKSAANITIVATAATARNIDTNGILTVSAESAYLKAKNPGTGPTVTNTYTATNVDNAKTVAPLYAITKSATTNLNNKNFDATNPDSFITYSITVKNEGNTTGTAVDISDALPANLIAIPSGQPNHLATITTATTGTNGISTLKSVSIPSDGRTVTVTAQNIKVGETITITFRAKKNPDTAIATGASITNYAVVKDDTTNDANATTPDITDRSDDTNDSTYENVVGGGGNYPGKDNNTLATVTTSNQTRAIAISPAGDKEVALNTPETITDVSNTYIYTITNNGTDITEAATKNSVLFSVNPTAATSQGPNDPDISVVRVFVDANNNGFYDATEVVLTGTAVAGTNEVTYDLNDAKAAGITPGSSVKIGVQIKTDGSNSNNGGVGTSDIGHSETMTLTVVPKDAVNGTAIPTSTTENPLSTTSKTTMQGINLIKYQIAADCGTTIPADNATTWSTNAATAEAGQCIFYRLEATNTFTETNKTISDVVIVDNLATTLAYQSATFAATPTTTDQTVGQKVKATFATLAPAAKVTIKFSAKPSQSGTN